jgi:hypothetical protein
MLIILEKPIETNCVFINTAEKRLRMRQPYL